MRSSDSTKEPTNPLDDEDDEVIEEDRPTSRQLNSRTASKENETSNNQIGSHQKSKVRAREYLDHKEIVKILKQINSSELLSFEDMKPLRRVMGVKGIKNKDSQMIEHSKGIGDRLKQVDLKLLDVGDAGDGAVLIGRKDEEEPETDDNMQTIFNEFKNFTAMHQENEKEQKERQLRLEGMKQRSKGISELLNDFRPTKQKVVDKKEYYNRWYVPVRYWNVEKLKDANARQLEHLKRGRKPLLYPIVTRHRRWVHLQKPTQVRQSI